MNDFYKYMFGMVILGVVLIAVVMWFVVWSMNKSCLAEWSSFPNRWSFWSDCQIYVGGKWIPASSYYFKQQ